MKKYLTLLLAVAFSVNAIAQFATTVGSFRVTTLSEGAGNGSATLLSGTTEEILKKYLPDGTFPIQTNAFLVQTKNQNILIDTGYGRNLFDNLHALNVTESQIDIILLTHMHSDHIGGLLIDNKAAFPNAKLYVSQAEYDYWVGQDNNTKIQAIFAAYKTKLHLFEPVDLGSDKELFSGVQGIKAYGHTPGHTVYMIKSDNDCLLIWGDIIHATNVQMPHPEITLSFDVNPALAKETRFRLLEYVAKNKIHIGGMHIVSPSIGTIRASKKEEGAYVFIPLAQDITEENYLKAIETIQADFSRNIEELSEFAQKHPEKRDSLFVIWEHLNATLSKRGAETLIEYAAAFETAEFLENLYRLRLHAPKEAVRSILKTFSDDIQALPYAKSLLYHVETEQVTEGGKYDDFQAFNAEGKSFSLSSLEDKNILLLFGGLDCMREEGRKDLNKINSKVSRDNLEIVVFCATSSNLEGLQQEQLKYQQSLPFDYFLVSDFLQDHSPMKLLYGVQATPTCFLINREGIVVMRTTGLNYELVLQLMNSFS